MSRRENESLYVPIGDPNINKSRLRKFIDRHGLPTVKEMLTAAGVAVAVFVAVWLVLLISGLRLTSVSYDTGTTYHYFGWFSGDTPSVGIFHCSDGSVASVSGGDFYYSDGSVYKGQKLGFMKHGQGVLTFADGSSYTGGFENDQYSGYGVYVGADKSTYEGNYKNGLYDGVGKLTDAYGNVYEGEFLSGEKSGQGSMTYIGGDRFVGEFGNDMRKSGVYYWRTGDSLECDKFVNNLPSTSQKVVYVDAAGDRHSCYYIRGQLATKPEYSEYDSVTGDKDESTESTKPADTTTQAPSEALPSPVG